MRTDIVETAFDDLVRAGIEPSLRKLRERIGFGSLTDIHRIVVGIRSERSNEDAASETLPAEVKSFSDRMILQIWGAARMEATKAVEQAKTAANERIAEAEEGHAAALKETDALLLERDEEHARAQRLAHDLVQQTDARVAAEQRAAVAEQRCLDLEARVLDLQHAIEAIRPSAKTKGPSSSRKQSRLSLQDVGS